MDRAGKDMTEALAMLENLSLMALPRYSPELETHASFWVRQVENFCVLQAMSKKLTFRGRGMLVYFHIVKITVFFNLYCLGGE